MFEERSESCNDGWFKHIKKTKKKKKTTIKPKLSSYKYYNSKNYETNLWL